MAVSFIDGGNRGIPRKPSQGTGKLYNIILHRVHLDISGIRTHNFISHKWIYVLVETYTTMWRENTGQCYSSLAL